MNRNSSGLKYAAQWVAGHARLIPPADDWPELARYTSYHRESGLVQLRNSALAQHALGDWERREHA